ncbi:MAG: hypothetical protein JSV61_07565 [Anaerolineales bacterium]|nr:MAG: hypothetical protein JSV61_07565 [Anaerolineales bacterium]
MAQEATQAPLEGLHTQNVSERTLASRMIRSLRERPARGIGLVILGLIILAVVFAPLITPQGPDETSLEYRLRPPFWIDGSISP